MRALCIGGVLDGKRHDVEGQTMVVSTMPFISWTSPPISENEKISFHRYDLHSIQCDGIVWYVYVLDSLSLNKAIHMLMDSYAAANNKDE